LITDVDDTLLGDDPALRKLLGLLEANREDVGWGIATGRCLSMTLDALEEHDIPSPDIILSSVGTEIYYGPSHRPDREWLQHLAYQWKPDMIKDVLSELTFLDLQEEETQRRFKISYYIDMRNDPELLTVVHKALQDKKIKYNLVFSNGQFLDILPFRSSKGKAVRYLSYKWELPLLNILVCGDSGNDEDMLRGNTCGLVVGNYSEELESLRGLRRTFFTESEYAAGVIDGIRHYRFLENIQ
ncbi:MAG: HAD family hydrolase, partial [Desulfobulbaceae bacterium]|nr:HAD family hydrolase [Desulfobulbaceae bacterium]